MTRRKKQILVIIDMQPFFKASHKIETVNNILKEIKKAKSRNTWIVIVEFAAVGKTLTIIRNELKNYKKVIYKRKASNDGSAVILNSLKMKPVHSLQVCGVNTLACVRDTVIGLLGKSNYKINLNLNNCNDDGYHYNPYNIPQIKKRFGNNSRLKIFKH